MRVLVTGGKGFIGSNLVRRLLEDGYHVTVFDNLSTGRNENLVDLDGNYEFINCDLSIPGDWQLLVKNFDWIFHLAALADIVPSIENAESYFKSNVDGTFNLLQACKDAGIKKFLYAASSSCYGIPAAFPTPESSKIQPQYPYALTKRLGEELALHWCNVYGLPVISLRLFNVYGKKSRTSGTYGAVFGVFLAQKLAGKSFTVVGDGNQTRDFTYVSDVVEAFISAASSSFSGEVFNVGSGETISVNTIVGMLGGPVVNIPKRPGEPDCTFADIGKIKSMLKWSPKVRIDAGLKEICSDIEYWSDAPVWNPETIANATASWFKYLK